MNKTLGSKTWIAILVIAVVLIGIYIYSVYTIEIPVTQPPIEPPIDMGPKNPTTQNTKADFGGTNLGDSIHFSWSPADRANEYVRFRSLSINGPWEEEGHILGSLTNGVDVTPGAREKTLCYRLEARDEKGSVVRDYEPICVPKFEE